jgi:hypothetical protein
MFKIIPVQDFEYQKQIALSCGRTAKDGYFAYAMTDYETDKPMGFSQFEIDGEYGILADLSSATGLDDFEAMFILGRQTMNFIDKCGAHKCKAYFSTADVKLLTSIGFKSDDGINYFCDMTNMFDGHCDK